MPRLLLPDSQAVQSTPINAGGVAGAVASSAKLGDLQGQAANAVAERAKLGEMQSTQGAEAAARSGQVGLIMMGEGAAAAAQYADIGKSAMALGQNVATQGSEYFTNAMDSINGAILNTNLTDASKEFRQRVEERKNKLYDDKGNPTFSTLQSDIDSIGQDVQSKYGSKIGDSASQQKFTSMFGEQAANTSIMAMGEARSQQRQYSIGALSNSLNEAKINALSSEKEMLPQILTQGNAQIDAAVKAGDLTPEEGVVQKDKLRQSVNVGWLQVQNHKSPLAATQILSASDADLGITPTERIQLENQNSQSLNALQTQNKQRAAEEKALQTEVYTRNKLELQLGIDKGTITEADISASYIRGDIDQASMVALTEKRMKSTGESAQKTEQRAEIGKAVHGGEVLSGKFSPSQIDDHYKYSLALQGGNVPLFSPDAPVDKARLASTYKAPIPSFVQEISGVMQSGTPAQVLEAVKATTYIQEKNPVAVSTMDAKTQGLISSIELQAKYSKEDLGVIVANARKQIFDTNPTIEKERQSKFASEDSFNPKNMQDTIKSMYGSNWFGASPLPDYATPIVASLLKQNYLVTGDAQVAIEMTKKQTAGIIGESTINGPKATMFLPPENAYPNYNYEVGGKSVLRLDAEHEVVPFLKDGAWAHNAGIKPEDIEVQSYYGTSRREGDASYALYNKETHQPIVNPDNGQALIWTPDKSYMSDLKTQDSEQKRQQAILNPSLMQGVESPYSGSGSQKDIVKTALGYLGFNETSHQEVLGSFMKRSLNQSVDPSQVPWCAGFASAVLGQNGIAAPHNALSARAFLNWGNPTTAPQKGDIVVLSRGSDTSKGHVGFYMGEGADGSIKVLGGNQGDSVEIKEFPKASVLGYRQPPSSSEIKQGYDSGKFMPNSKALPVGLRQNNPGNLVKTGERWTGEVPNATSRFKEFASPEDGIAGIVRSLQTKAVMRGQTTPYDLIYGKQVGTKRVGAYSETDQAEYAKNIASALGIGLHDKYNLKDPKQIMTILKTIIKQENGYIPYSDDVIHTGILRGK